MTIAMRHVVKFPARVIGTKGVDLDRENGTYTFKLNYENLTPAASVGSNVSVAFQDPATGEMGVTSLASALNSNSNIQAIANATTAADKLGYWNGASSYALTDFTSFGRALVALNDAAAARLSLGVPATSDLGTAAAADATDFATSAQGAKADSAVQPADLSTVATSGAYSDLSGLPTLGDLAAKDKAAIADISATGTPSSSTYLRGDGTWGAPAGGGDMVAANNLSDLTDSETALGNLSFLQTGTGAVARPAIVKMRDIVSVKDFGAKGDGSTDDTAAMQAAHDTGETIYYPRGTYPHSNVTATAGSAYGDGYDSILMLNHATNDGLVFSIPDTYSGPSIRDLRFTSNVTKTAGASLKINCSTVGGEVYWTDISNAIFFQEQYDCLVLESVKQFNITGCRFVNYSNTGVTTHNDSNPDGGDWCISNSVFNTAVSTGARTGIRYFSGGGGKVIGNKFLGGNGGISVNINHNSAMADLLIANNSIEDYLTAGISLSRDSGKTGTLGGIDIIGNNIAGPNAAYGVFSSVGAIAFVDLNIKANRFYTSSNGVNHIGLAYINGCAIDGNSFDAASGTTGGTGITCDSNCVDVFIGAGNTFQRIATPITNSSSTGTTQLHSQSGSSSAATPSSANYGSFFVGNGSVAFPQAFSTTPASVVANVKDGSGVGGVSVMVSGLTSTGFSFQVVGISASQTIPIVWEAKGIIAW